MRQFKVRFSGILSALLFTLPITPPAAAQPADPVPLIPAAAAGMDAERLEVIDEIVREGLSQGKMPGCVVVVGRSSGVVLKRAWGFRQTIPVQVPMAVDTVFDLASLTKPIATATSILILAGEGRLDVEAPVSHYWPEFAQNGKEQVSVRHLLTHTSGLIADNSINDYSGTPDESLQKIAALKLTAQPGTEFIYSDVGFIVLGHLVQRISGEDLNGFSRRAIFEPLGMRETGYLPSELLRGRTAVTEQREDRWMQGEVHDPRAWRLGGVAGHAGLFSTADDLSRYAIMMLSRGIAGDRRILDETTWQLMTTSVEVPRGRRALGWDARTGYSSNRGDLMSSSAFGHGGFTGTGIWIDPVRDLFVIFLSNRVHPDGKGLVNPLIGRVGTLAAAALENRQPEPLSPRPTAEPGNVLNGIDVLERDGFARLQGRRVGLITNQTGLNRIGTGTIRLLAEAPGVELRALFSPEHGLEGKLDIPKIGDQQDVTTGLRVFSLYGETRTPTPESLAGLDTLVFDIQDIGCRFYTYLSTMQNAMRAAAEHSLQFVVLDRVNPVGGLAVSGPVLEEGLQSFVGCHTIPVRHGMTAGELARLFQRELFPRLNLQVIACEGWKRSQMFDETGLTWTNPSPNMRNLNQALLYPGVGLVELTNISVGRGTDTPFEVLGAPWIQERQLATALNAAGLPGIRFVPVRFTPSAARFPGETCGGVQLIITSREQLDPIALGIQLMCTLKTLYPQDWDVKNLNKLLASSRVRDAVLAGKSPQEISGIWQDELRRFRDRRSGVLLYP
ncbi:MAG: exo-beta-N-acetylmuramidase NamZ domain-containing protein [Planctomycetota bacterium]